ncbi:MAG TPA: HNH endonuclease [Gallionellaceae bacterium]|nr:HNH endonuclease [Gallionellaceae bacterium]
MIDVDLFADRLAARFGLSLTSEQNVDSDHSYVSLRVGGIDAPNGFRVNITLGWRSAEASFVPDTFASGLIKTLCADESKRRLEFASLSSAFTSTGTKCVARIDERTADLSALPEGKWNRFELNCSRLTDKSDAQHDAEEVGGACLALLLSLLPTEEDEVETSSLGQGLPEGALTRVAVNRYERRPANRAAAIAAHGATCIACGFDFALFYGVIGEGFIEVHHRTPVSNMGGSYVIDPVKDLVPLCSNCHQMVHREDPPINAEELRAILAERGVIHMDNKAS